MVKMEKISAALVDFLKNERDTINRIWNRDTMDHPQLSSVFFLEYWGRLVTGVYGDVSSFTDMGPSFELLFQHMLDYYRKQSIYYEGFFQEDLPGFIIHFGKAILIDSFAFLNSFQKVCAALNQYQPRHLREWIQSMQNCLLGDCPIIRFRETGLVLAWKSGLAAYRKTALSLLHSMSARDFGLIFGLELMNDALKQSHLEYLETDRWYRLEEEAPHQGIRHFIKGNFQGFGGEFLAPPQFMKNEQGLLLYSGEDIYEVFMDAYGFQLVRKQVPGDYKVCRDFTVSDHKIQLPQYKTLPLPPEWPLYLNSAVIKEDACYFTSELSFHVYVVVAHAG